MYGKVKRVVETEKARVVTVTVEKPWHGNPWQDYDFESTILQIGDEVFIDCWPRRMEPTSADLDAVAVEQEISSATADSSPF